jgi:hypothetical protein
MEPNALVAEWMETGWLLGIGVGGVILIVLGLNRDDIIGWIFLAAGVALAALGFGAQFLGWNPLGL